MASTEVNITSFSEEGLSQIHDIVNAAIKGIFNSKEYNSKNSTASSAAETQDKKSDVKDFKNVASAVKALVSSTSELKLKNVIALRTLANTISKENFVKSFSNLASVSETIKPNNFKGIYQLAEGLQKLSEVTIVGSVRLRLGTNTYVNTLKKFLEQLSDEKTMKVASIGAITSFAAGLKQLSEIPFRGAVRLRLGTNTYVNALKGFLKAIGDIKIDKDTFSSKNEAFLVVNSISKMLETISKFDGKYRRNILITMLLLRQTVANGLSAFLTKLNEVYKQALKDKVLSQDSKSPTMLDSITYFLESLANIGIRSRTRINATSKLLKTVATSISDFTTEISKAKMNDSTVKTVKTTIDLIKYIYKNLPGSLANKMSATLVSGYLSVIAPAIIKFGKEIDEAKLPSNAKVTKVKMLVNLVKGLALTMAGITLVLTGVIALGGGKMIWQAFGMMTAFLTMSVGIVAILSKIKMGNIAKGMLAIGGITLIVGGLVMLSKSIADLAQIEWKDFGKGSLMIGAAFGVVTLIGALLAGVGALLTVVTGGAGILALGVGALAVVAIAELTKYIAKSLIDLIEKSNQITEAGQTIDTKMMWSSTWKITQMFGSVLALTTAMAAAGLVVVAEVAVGGLGMLAFIGVSWLIRKTIREYIGLMDEVNALDFKKIETAHELITGKKGLFDSMQSLATEFSKIHVGVKAVITSLAKTKVFNDMFDMLSRFIDIIQKMSNLQYISGHNANGTPIYSSYNPEMFQGSAEALCNGFSAFIDTVDKSFETFNKDKSPKLLQKIAKSFNPIIDTISKFIDVITTYSKGVPDGFDDKGNVKYRPWQKDEYINAANAVINSFDLFLNTVESGVDTMDKKKANALKNNFGNTLLPLVNNLKLHHGNIEKYINHATNVKDAIKRINDGGLKLDILSQQIGDAIGEYSLNDKSPDTTRFDNYTKKIDKVLDKYKDFSKSSEKFVKSLKDISKTQDDTGKAFVNLGNDIRKANINDKVKEMTKSFAELADKIQSVVDKFEDYGESVEQLRKLQITDMEDRKEERVEKAKSKSSNSSNVGQSANNTNSVQSAPIQNVQGNTYNNIVNNVTGASQQMQYQPNENGAPEQANTQYVPIIQNMNDRGPLIITITEGGDQIILKGEYKYQ